MFYAAYRRARQAVTIYTIILAALIATGVIIALISSGGHVVLTDGKDRHMMGNGNSWSGFALILAYTLAFLGTAQGMTLASENDGHLEFAWARPISRQRYALGIVAIDLAGMLAAFLISYVIAIAGTFAVGAGQILTSSPFFTSDFSAALMALGFPFLLYAWVMAISASLRRGRAFSLLIWPVMFVLLLLAQAHTAIQPAMVWLNAYVNPLQIFAQDEHHDLTVPVALYGTTFAIALIALAVAQWRRLEA